MVAKSTSDWVDGTEIPISHALTPERVIPSRFASSACVIDFCSRKHLIRSATIQSPLECIVSQSKRYYIIRMIVIIDNSERA